MCTTVSFLKKACIQRWLNREMISATILSGHKWNDVIDVDHFDANILRDRRSLQKTTMACSNMIICLTPTSYVVRCRRHTGWMKAQHYRFYEFIITRMRSNPR